LEHTELADALRGALGCIPAKQAQAFCLHGIEGYSYEDIAELMDVSVNGVGVLLHRARKRLQVLLARFYESQRETRHGVAAITQIKTAASMAGKENQ
jgi:RNA polymerase sigma-70 factor (ECF subfamily)